MADDLTIDAYLEALRRRVRGHHERDALVDEVEDHLRSAAERQVASGVPPADAEARTIARFGEADVIGAALLESNGPPAVPNGFTTTTGRTLTVGSVAWVVLAGAFWLAHLLETEGGHDWEGLPRLAFMVGMGGLAAGGFLTLLLALALRQRQGETGPVSLIGVGFAGLATAASVVAWAIPLWSTLLALACLPLAFVALRFGAAPRRFAVLLGLAWPLSLAAFAVLRVNEFGTVDEFGDYPASHLGSAMTVGCALMVAAFLGLGRWLRSEEPVESLRRATHVPTSPNAMSR